MECIRSEMGLSGSPINLSQEAVDSVEEFIENEELKQKKKTEIGE